MKSVPTARARVLTLLALALLVQAAAAAAPARAQVAVLRVDPAADGLCRALEAVLTDMQLVRDPGYLQAAAEQRMDPSADDTLQMIVPLFGLRLAVVPQSADERRVNVDFRDGRSGTTLGMVAVPLDNGYLGPMGREILRREVYRRLGGAAPPTRGAPPATGPPAEDVELGEGGEAEDEAGEPASVVAELVVGVGVGTRDLVWAQNGQDQRVATGLFPAYELRSSVALGLSESTTLSVQLAYQSSLAHEVKETHLAAPEESVGIRAAHFSALLALGLSLDDDGDFAIVPAVGFDVRALHPEVHHLLTPSYSLTGPLARLGFSLRFGEVRLSLGPEAQYVLVGDALEEVGVEATGVSVGGEASLGVALSSAIAIDLGYREAHALLSALEGSASDVERFVTARVRWTP